MAAGDAEGVGDAETDDIHVMLEGIGFIELREELRSGTTGGPAWNEAIGRIHDAIVVHLKRRFGSEVAGSAMLSAFRSNLSAMGSSELTKPFPSDTSEQGIIDGLRILHNHLLQAALKKALKRIAPRRREVELAVIQERGHEPRAHPGGDDQSDWDEAIRAEIAERFRMMVRELRQSESAPYRKVTWHFLLRKYRLEKITDRELGIIIGRCPRMVGKARARLDAAWERILRDAEWSYEEFRNELRHRID